MSARSAAEAALWAALEERREEIREAGLRFSERQHAHLRKAHDSGRLIAAVCGAMEDYVGGSQANPYYLRPMAEAIKNGLRTWEHVLIEKGTPWRPYITPKARDEARRCIADATAYISAL